MSLSRRSAVIWCSQSQASNPSRTFSQFQQWVIKKTRIVALGVLLGLGGGFWLINEVLRPQAAGAYTVRVNLSVNRQHNESYETLVQRAKEVALKTTQQRFYQNVRITKVSVIIVGQNQGAIAPVLSLQVSRPEWRSQMASCDENQSASNCLDNNQQWVRYFSDARVLLGFRDVADNTASQPDTANQTTPEQATNSNSAKPENTNPATAPGQTPQSDPDDRGPQSPDAIVPVEVPDNSQNSTTPQDGVSSDSPSTSTPTDTPQVPSGAPTSVPSSSDSGQF